jgi:rSAM/selenodomain-associated transferase 1
MTFECAIIVFAKAPIAGAVKTRLIPALGAQGAAQLAARMLDDALFRAWDAGIGPVELCCAPDAAHPRFRAAEVSGTVLTLQGDDDLGQRMHRALARALTQFSRALLIGTDAPALEPQILREAAASLATDDAVCVPAFDGDYVLIGLRRPCADLFADIAWSSAEVMQQTRARATQAGISLKELPMQHDIDEPGDLRHLPKEWLT